MFTRRNTDCENHEWTTTVHAGLRRDLCSVCGRLQLETVAAVSTRLPIFAESHMDRTFTPFGATDSS